MRYRAFNEVTFLQKKSINDNFNHSRKIKELRKEK
jgi:hypothetical protein